MAQRHRVGLGLPISRKFIELHHGRMGVDSMLGQGTSFWFTLPASPDLGAHALEVSSTSNPYITRLGASERIVVVVHEDPYVVTLLQRYLEGYRLVGAPSMAEGLVLAEQIKALAIVTDATTDRSGATGGLPGHSLPTSQPPANRNCAGRG